MKETTNNDLLKFMKEQFEKVEAKSEDRFVKLDSRLNGLENRIDDIAGKFTQDFFSRFAKLEEQVHKLMASK